MTNATTKQLSGDNRTVYAFAATNTSLFYGTQTVQVCSAFFPQHDTPVSHNTKRFVSSLAIYGCFTLVNDRDRRWTSTFSEVPGMIVLVETPVGMELSKLFEILISFGLLRIFLSLSLQCFICLFQPSHYCVRVYGGYVIFLHTIVKIPMTKTKNITSMEQKITIEEENTETLNCYLPRHITTEKSRVTPKESA